MKKRYPQGGYHNCQVVVLLMGTILVFGMGFSAPIADYISQRLTLNGFCTMSVVHMEMLNASFQDSTFLIVISNSGITTRLEEVVETAKNNHIDIITFTGNEKSKISQYSTLPIIIGHYNPFYHDNLVPNAFFGQVLIIFESLLYSFFA